MAHDLTAPVVALKEHEDARVVIGPVLVPGEPDKVGDVATKEHIERVAHLWLRKYRNIDRMHTLDNRADPVESYITPQELTFKTPYGEAVSVPAGTWMLGAHVSDDDTWSSVKSGDLRGFSIMAVNPAGSGAFKDAEAATKNVTLADLEGMTGEESWIVPAVSLVDEPCVPKAKYVAIKRKPAGDDGLLEKLIETLKGATEALKANDATDNEEKETEEMDAEELEGAIKSAIEPLVERIDALESAEKEDDEPVDEPVDSPDDSPDEDEGDDEEADDEPDDDDDEEDDDDEADDASDDEVAEKVAELTDRIAELEASNKRRVPFSNRIIGQESDDSDDKVEKGSGSGRDIFGRRTS